MKKEWIDVCSYDGEGYLPLITYQSWRVAELRYCEELEVKNLDKSMMKRMRFLCF